MRFTALFLFLSVTACAQPTVENADAERAERIEANLRFEFPQLAAVDIVVNAIEPMDIAGLQRGSFTINGRSEQAFLITPDDTQLFIVSGDAIDASRTAEGIAEAEQERLLEGAEEARERAVLLNETFADLPVRGNPDAPITIVEFSDFECPFCQRVVGTVERLVEENDDVRLVYVQYPLPNHPWARPASIAALCAAQQEPEAFWTLHDRYFEHQRSLTPETIESRTVEFLADSGVDQETWRTCMTDESSEAHREAVAQLDAGMNVAGEVGVQGTPSFFVNGRFLNGAKPYSEFESLIEAARTELE